MSVTQLTFATARQAKALTGQRYPHAKNIRVVEHSYDNIVVLVDENYAVRFPRDAAAFARSQHEKAILQRLKSLQSVVIPQVLAEHNDPPYLLTTFIPGSHLSSRAIGELPLDLQKEFGRTVAKFAYEMHSTVPLGMEIKLRQQLQLDEQKEEPWDEYFKKRFTQHGFQTDLQTQVAQYYYQRWLAGPDGPLVVVHDDLHTENMLFDHNRLTGILDFGDTTIGIAEQELRQLYRINDTVLAAAVEEYRQLSGQRLDVEVIQLWCITQELGVFSHMLTEHKTNHRVFARATRNLNRWLPEGQWGTGIMLTEEAGFQ